MELDDFKTCVLSVRAHLFNTGGPQPHPPVAIE